MKHIFLSTILAFCLLACVEKEPPPFPACWRIYEANRPCDIDWVCELNHNPEGEKLSKNCRDVGHWSDTRDEWCCNP